MHAALGERVETALNALFRDHAEYAAAARMLAEDCAPGTVPGLSGNGPGCERVRLGALKLCQGSLDRLAEAIALSQTDYRDLLVAAGFGDDTRAHLDWHPGNPDA